MLAVALAAGCGFPASPGDTVGERLLCPPRACGPAPGMPNWKCPDGTVGGPTGRCLPLPQGGCGWEVRWCEWAPCGGIGGFGCRDNQVCVDDPRDACNPATGEDCSGVCVTPVFCGGIAGIPCPTGQACVDDPRDTCEPASGGRDCSGLCAPSR